MALRIQATHETQRRDFKHDNGPLEFGRGPQRDVPRCQIDDPNVSRDQLRIEELSDRRLRVKNLSRRIVAAVFGQDAIEAGQSREIPLPVRLQIGKTRIDISVATSAASNATAETIDNRGRHAGDATAIVSPPGPAKTGTDAPVDLACLASIPPPPVNRAARRGRSRATEPAETPADNSTDRLADWLQTIIDLQREAPASPSFFEQTAHAMMRLIELDLGLVLLRLEKGWNVVGAATSDDHVSVRYSRTLVDHVARERLTFYQDLDLLGPSTASLADVDAAVASPIFGLGDDVVGVLYGSRGTGKIVARGPIGRLEAQFAQLLAAAVGTNLTRAAALRTRVQFEQFFSPDLVHELERDPNLLDGRMAQVSILCSDLRGFTEISQRLGAAKTCDILRDIMERLTHWILEFGGVIVDFAGDGILAMWNAPTPQPDHAARACRAALAMLGEFPSLNQRWAGELPPNGRLALGIGINSGLAQVGNTGSSRRFKYGPHGHAVNLASRVQDATKRLGLPLLITASSRALLPVEIQSRRLGKVRLPGVAEPETLYELHGEQAATEWLTQRDMYEAALAEYESQQWSQACRTLLAIPKALQDQWQNDGPTLALLQRARECLANPPETFEAIIDDSKK